MHWSLIQTIYGKNFIIDSSLLIFTLAFLPEYPSSPSPEDFSTKVCFHCPHSFFSWKERFKFSFFACGGDRCTKSILKEVHLWLVLFSKSNVYCCILNKHVSWGTCNPHMTEPVDIEAERETVTGLEVQSCLTMGLVCTWRQYFQKPITFSNLKC